MGNGISSDKPTRKEKFTPSVNDQQADLFQRNFMRYNTTEPNIFIIDPKYQSNIHDPANTNDIFSIFNTYNNSNTEGRKTSVTPLSRIFDFLVSPSVSPELISANNFCKTFNSLENNVIEYYRNYHLESAETRCGWTYNTNYNGRIRFEGHLGHNGNPIISLDSEYITHSNTRWFWNLPDAMLLFNSYRCRVTVSNCSNINSNCVWSQGLGHSIPRLQSDIYKPEENAVYRTKELCPATSVPDTGINPEITSETNVLSGLPFCTDSVKISRDCLNNILTKYKCDTGALKYALNNDGLSGIAADHGIREIPSFMRYNQVHVANNNFFNSATGPDTTLNNALEYFNQLSNYTHSTSNNVINFAARDLCTRRNAYQEFNFCSEYVTGTTKPASGWLMNCIQDTFRRKGGQITGTEYPTANNMSPLWNTFSTWGQIEAYINRLVSDTTSSNIDVEAAAYSKFYGIPTQQFTRQYVSRIPGIEVFWFSIINSSASSPGTIDKFLGRRIQDTLTLQTPTETTNIQFISFFNLRTAVHNKKVQFSYTVKNGIKVLQNTWINTLDNNSDPTSYGQIMAAWYPVTTPTSYSNASNVPTDCWSLSSNNANYFTIAWHAGATPGSFTNNYFQTCDVSPMPISANDFTMTQEPDAPMLSYEVFPQPTQTQLNYYSADQILTYFFGDTRLWKVFPIDKIGSESPLGFINNNEHFGFSTRYTQTNNSYTSRSYIYGAVRTSSSGILQTGKIGSQSWRTITMLFKTGSLTDITAVNTTHYIFQYGMISIGIKNMGTSASPNYTCVIHKKSGIDSGYTSLNTILRDTYYYLILIQDVDNNYAVTVPSILRVCCVSLASVQGDTTIPLARNTNNNLKIYYEGGQQLWPTVDLSEYKASIGGKDSLGTTQTVVMDVGWLRFFDYSFTTDDVANDVNNRWQKHWFNII